MSEPQRVSSLDGLRGIAAVVVVIHHALLTLPGFADAYYDTADGSPLAWVLSYTPLHAFWAGTEAVYLFFVLSGMVLVLPVIRQGRSFSWLAYYPRRVLRLYLPVIAAVVFAAVLVALVPRFDAPGLGAWINDRTPRYNLDGFLHDIALLFGTSGVISPIWSLRWEVLFSLLLPLFVLLAVLFRALWWPKLLAMFAMTAVASMFGIDYLFFLPIFGIGALLIVEWERVTAAMSRLDQNRWAWPAYLVVAVLLTTATWLVLGFGLTGIERFVAWVPIVGVTMIVVAGATFAPFTRFLETPVVAWLGAVSFALYLVHEPLIIAARFVTYPLSPWVGIAISVPLVFVVAWLFARYIEQPAHRFSKWAGARLAATRSGPPRGATEGGGDTSRRA